MGFARIINLYPTARRHGREIAETRGLRWGKAASLRGFRRPGQELLRVGHQSPCVCAAALRSERRTHDPSTTSGDRVPTTRRLPESGQSTSYRECVCQRDSPGPVPSADGVLTVTDDASGRRYRSRRNGPKRSSSPARRTAPRRQRVRRYESRAEAPWCQPTVSFRQSERDEAAVCAGTHAPSARKVDSWRSRPRPEIDR